MRMGRFHASWQGYAHPLVSFLGVFCLAEQGMDRIALLQEIPEASRQVSIPRGRAKDNSLVMLSEHPILL